jgi:hypothetical protein
MQRLGESSNLCDVASQDSQMSESWWPSGPRPTGILASPLKVEDVEGQP